MQRCASSSFSSSLIKDVKRLLYGVARGLVVTALDLQVEIAGSIPATALLSATLGKMFTHTLPLSLSGIIWYQCNLRRKQAHHATQLPHVHGHTALAGARSKAIE